MDKTINYQMKHVIILLYLKHYESKKRNKEYYISEY